MTGVQRRVAWIDALRCAAILMVVGGHTLAELLMHHNPGPGFVEFFGGWLDPAGVNHIGYNLIASVYMPLFAFVSGAAQGHKGLKVPWRSVRSRVRSLLLPYFAWLFVWALFSLDVISADPGSWLRSVGLAAVQPRTTGLWFLYALFAVQVAAAIVTSISDNPRVLAVSALGMTILMLFLKTDIFGVGDLAWLYPFFVLGMLESHLGFLKKRKWLLAGAIAYPVSLALVWPTIVEVPRWWVAGTAALLARLPLVPHPVEAWIPPLTIHYARYLAAAAGIVLLYNLYVRLPRAALEMQAPVGQASLGIYAIHYRLVTALIGAGIHSGAIVFTVAAAVSFVITLAIDRIPVVRTLLLGKPWRKTCRTSEPTPAPLAAGEPAG